MFKRIICLFAIISVSVLAQVKISEKEVLTEISKNYPDSLFLLKGWPNQSCYIYKFNDDDVELSYQKNDIIKLKYQQIKEIKIDSLGTVYKNPGGFKIKKEILDEYISQRFRSFTAVFTSQKQESINREASFEKEIKKLKNQERMVAGSEVSVGEGIKQQGVKFQPLKWSFGFNYIPYNSGEIYTIGADINNVNWYRNSETKLEGEFTYLLTAHLKLTADIGYQASVISSKDENSQTYLQNSYFSIRETENKIKLFSFNIGIRYYIVDINSLKSSAFVFAGFGRQIALVTDQQSIIFPGQEPNPKMENNLEEFLEQLNSPYKLNLGFGAEYFFNDAIAIKSFIRLNYFKISGDYKYRFVTVSQNNSRQFHYERGETTTEVGFGLNFYF